MPRIIYCLIVCLLFVAKLEIVKSFDVTHNIPSLSHISRYADCAIQLNTQAAAKCFIKFTSILNNQPFNPANQAHCCADWESLSCIKGIGLTDPKCAIARELIETEMNQKEVTNVKDICDPYKFKCPNAPSTGLKKQFPKCYEKVKDLLEGCKPKPYDFGYV